MHQLIDREGRIFGVINVIDALVLAVVLTLTPALYYGYRLVRQPPPPPPVAPAPPPPPTWVTARALMVGMSYEALALVSQGDVEMEETAGGGERVRVLAVGSIDTIGMTRSVVIAVRCTQEGSRSRLYRGKPVKVGSRLVLESEEWDGVALVQEFRLGEVDPSQLMSAATTSLGETTRRERIVVRVLIQNLLPELVAALRVGDQWESSTDRQALRVVAVGAPVAGTVSGLVAVRCDVEVESIASGNSWLYERDPLKIGRVLRVETDRYSFEGTILSVAPVGSEGDAGDAGA